MKYRLIASALLVAVLAGLAVVVSEDTAPRAATAQPAGTDDAAMKSLSIN